MTMEQPQQDLFDPGDDWVVIGGYGVLKVMDEDGEVYFLDRMVGELRVPEAVGMLQLSIARMTQQFCAEGPVS